MCSASFFSVGGGILDAFTLEMLGPAGHATYGKYRLWTAVSWGIGGACMGAVAEVNFDYNFITFGVLNFVCVAVFAFATPRWTSSELQRVQVTATAHPCPSVTPRIVAFLAEYAFIGAAATVVDSFLFIYATEELGASYRLCGCARALTAKTCAR